MNTTLGVSITGGLESTVIDESRVSVELEQDLPVETPLTLHDVYEMWVAARGGNSARIVRPDNGCPITFTETGVVFTLAFFVWPFPEDTPYQLSATIGTISDPTLVRRSREESIIFPLSNTVETGKEISNITYEWETPAYTRLGVLVPSPSITVVRDTLTIPDSLFAVARVKFIEKGRRHTLEIALDTVDEDGNNLEITGLSPVVTALWIDEEGNSQTTQLTLVLPLCIEEALKLCRAEGGTLCQPSGSSRVIVYFNICGKDEIIRVKRIPIGGGASGRWCSAI